ncbi:hypothetical protein BGZ73_001469 [Actinomortierella ambigua]|nr:hypothetical protein BGZ73_001469 [Actinomortierella ambigua]
MVNVREASHAGSWYTSSREKLDTQLTTWLEKAGQETKDGETLPIRNLRAIIAPHAGYSYSGPSAAFAYKCIDPSKFKRVFLLGPSHHVYLPGCALSKCDEYETPLGNLIIDKEVNKKLHATGQFTEMSFDTDEREHSLEMHLPYLYKIFEPNTTCSSSTLRVDPPPVVLVPILVGALTTAKEAHYGELLAPYLQDPDNLFVISTDFCHWGTRFDYTYYADNHGNVTHQLHAAQKKGKLATTPQDPAIFTSIEKLDHEGMALIETGSHRAFAEYLHRTKNTICGRHPIGVLMAAIEALEKTKQAQSEAASEGVSQHCIRFVHYAQSSHVHTIHDSSVSYASAFCAMDA